MPKNQRAPPLWQLDLYSEENCRLGWQLRSLLQHVPFLRIDGQIIGPVYRINSDFLIPEEIAMAHLRVD
ncbi:MAG: hypothetical protein P5701_25125, partial [Limnospira sp. Paracas R14]|nr:hypothetical protein [Limnospira sp. Paracas R14]